MNFRTILRVAAAAGVAAWVVSAILAQQSSRALAHAFPAKLLASPSTCTTPLWPKEAQRYEVEGITVLHFQISPEGVVDDAKVAQSSSWKLLDDAALASLVKCRFKPGMDSAEREKIFPVQFVWTLTGPASVRPQLVENSCTASARFAGFKAFDRHPTDRDGVLVRLLVSDKGEPFGIKAEADGEFAEAGAEAAAYIKTCRFATDPTQPGEKTDTVFGRVLTAAK